MGQVIYDKNGLSAYASMEEVELVKAMLKTRTGAKQLDKIANIPVDIVVIIDNSKAPKGQYGYRKLYGIKYNTQSLSFQFSNISTTFLRLLLGYIFSSCAK